METRQKSKKRNEQQEHQTPIMPNRNLIFQSQINSIETFTGTSTQDAQRWITHATHILNIQGFSDPKELATLLSGFLDGEALNWFQQHKSTLSDWNMFRAAFVQRFLSPPSICNKFEYFQQLSNRRQGLEESTVDYYTQVMSLCHNYNPSMSDNECVDHLKKSLRPSLLEKVLDRDPTTPADFIAIVVKGESNQRILQIQFEVDPPSNSYYNNNNNNNNNNNRNQNNISTDQAPQIHNFNHNRQNPECTNNVNNDGLTHNHGIQPECIEVKHATHVENKDIFHLHAISTGCEATRWSCLLHE
jgi:hypothetical protein